MTQFYRYRVCDVPIADPAACAAVLVPTQLASRRAPLVSLQSPYSLLTGGVSCQPPVDELGTGNGRLCGIFTDQTMSYMPVGCKIQVRLLAKLTYSIANLQAGVRRPYAHWVQPIPDVGVSGSELTDLAFVL